jgi:hypothetical protein
VDGLGEKGGQERSRWHLCLQIGREDEAIGRREVQQRSRK